MNAASHDLVVKVGLTADLFVWARDEAEARGLSLSAFVRMLIIAERREQARFQITHDDREAASSGISLKRDGGAG